MTFLRITPEDYLKSKAMLTDNTTQMQISSEPSQNQGQPILVLQQQEDKTLIYIGIIIIGILAVMAMAAVLIKRGD
jgi:hypothetical protein